ncbi:YadA-like family protein [Moraxella haemolytica]|uniref:YadA-like family protein n=1 Tax=Moraxella haemolytica TaxID=2904119 RepID=UPI002543246A|nr:YadA-like family protein [Moraxella sp. ZY171148]WII95178.1 YadA-like family protein [Moraxella sp. ZY171148]
MIIGYAAIGRGEQVQNAIALGARANTGGNQTISIGADSVTVSQGNISIGSQASSRDPNSLAIGTGAKSSGGSVAIGNAAEAANTSIVVGYSSKSKSSNGTVLGISATNASNNGTVIGYGATVNANSLNGIAIGRSATVQTRSQGGIAIGSGTNIQGLNSLGIGTSAIAKGSSVAIGSSARADNSSIVIGIGSVGLSTNGVVLGNQAINNGKDSTVIGYGAKLSGDGADVFRVGRARELENSLVVGTDARAWSGHSVVLGREAQVGNANSDAVSGTAVGERAKALAYRSTALGSNALVDASGDGGIAIGRSALSNAPQGIAIGSGDADSARNPATVNAEGGVAIGHNARVDTDHKRAVAIGYSTTAGGAYNVVIGNGASASDSENVAIGRNSSASDTTARGDLTVGQKTFLANQWKAHNKTHSFSVGSSGSERVIQNVAAGTIGPNSTEAINGSQLYRIVEGIGFDVHDNAGAKKATVGIGNKVSFKKGNSGLVSVETATDGRTGGTQENARVTFDVITQGLESQNTKTKVMAASGPTGLAKSADVAQAINDVAEALQKDIKNIGVSWKLATKAGTGTAANRQHTITSNQTATFQAGKNIVLAQAAGTIDIAVKDSPTFNTITTTGIATIGGTLNANGGLTVANNKTVNFNNNRLTNVGNATADTDAVNKRQLDEKAAELTNTGLKFRGDSNEASKFFTRKLNEEVQITGGANENQLTTNNIGVVVNGSNLQVKLAKTLSGLTSVTTNSLTVNNSATFTQGITLGNANNGPKIVNNGDAIKVQKNGGGYARITNIWDGKDAFDAVNKGQLDELANTGLQFEGDSASDVATRKLGQKLNITGGANRDKLTNNNIGVVVGGNGLVVKLAKNISGLETIKTTGRITAGGGLTVTTGGVTVANGGITVTQGGLTVTAGPTNLNGGLTVTGNTQVAKLTATGDTSLKKVDVTGKLNVTGPTNLTGGATVGGNGLTVNNGGITVTRGGLTVQAGASSFGDKVTVTRGGLDVSGATTLGSTLNVTGAANVGGMLNANGGLTVARSQKVDFNNNKLTKVADAVADTDAVNKKQLDAWADKGIKFLGDSNKDGQHLTRKLGTDIKITGGADESKLTNNNIGVVVGDKGLEVKLSNTLTGLTSVTTESLTVNNGATISGKLTANNDFEAKGATTLRSTTASTLNVTGATNLTGGATVGGNGLTVNNGGIKVTRGGLTVQAGASSFGDKVTVTRGGLDVSGATTLGSTLNVTGAANVGGMLNANGGLTVARSQKVDFNNNKLTKVADAVADTDAVNKKQLDAWADKGIKFLGDSNKDGQHLTRKLGTDIKITGGADESKLTNNNIGVVVGDKGLEVKLSKTLTGLTSVATNSLTVNNGATIGGKLTARGGLTVTGGKTELQQGLEVTGDTKVANLTATGNTLLQKVDVAGALDVTGKTTVTQLEASGEVTLKDALIVEGQAQLKDTLVVDKQATFKQGVTLGDTTGPKIVRDGDNIKVQKNGGGAARITNIAAGEQDGDAVNFKQVKDGIAGITTKGLKFAGDINGEVHRELGQALTITGGVTQEGNLTDSNIGVVKNPNNQGLIVKLAKNLQNLDSVATNTLTTTGAATIGGGLTVTGDTSLQKVDVTGALDVTGKTTVTQLEASGEVTLKDALIVEGQAQLKDTLVVTKEATFNGAVTANQGLTVAQGNLEVTNGNTTLKTLTVNETLAVKQKATFEQGLDVTAGKTNLNGGLTVTGGKTELQQGLEVTGDTKVANLTATGNTLLQKVDVAGALDVTGKTTVTQLEASGEVTLKDALIVEGQAQLKDTLVVDKQATFKQGVTLGDTTGPKIVRDGDNIKVQKNGGGAARITNIAAGEQDGDAVNFKQVKDGIAGITTKGLKFAGDINGEVHRELGQALTITGGVTQEGNLTDSNIGVVKNPNNQGLIVKLAKNLQNLDSVATNTLTTTGAATIGGGLTVTGDTSLQKVDVTGALDVTGKTTVTQLEASGEVTLKDALIVEGQAQLKDTLVVTKEATFNGAVTANQGLTVAQGNLEVTNGNTTLKTLTVNETLAVKQKATFEQGLDVTAGKTNLNGGLTVTGGKTELQQGLEVTGDTKVANLTATGNTLLQKVDVAGALDVTGKTTVTQLEASGEVTLKDALIVEGQAQLKDTLVVDKQATFKQGVTLGDTTGPKIVRDGDNIKVQKNGGGAARITNIAAGEQDGDAVNFKQVKDGIAGITTKGLKFAGDINGEVHRELGQALTITGGVTQEGNLTDSNIGVVKNPNNQGLIVKLAKNLQNLDSVATNTLTTTGAATIGGGLTVTGDTSLQKVDVTGALDVTGKTTVTQLEASGEVTLKDALIVEGQAQLKDTLVVTKEATFNGAVTANQGLTVAQGNLEVTNGNTTLKTLTVNETLAVKQKATFEQGLDVTAGKTNLNGGLTVTGGKTELQQGLEVTGDTKVANLTATGNTLLQKVDVAGALDVTGKTTVTQLEASGEVTLKDALIVEGQAQLKDTLVVDKQATFKQGVTLGDTTGPKIVRDGDNIKVQKNGGGAARITNIAAGEQDGDAVNFKQVKDGIAGITTKGLKFAGDINGEVHRELGQALTITGGVTQEGNLTDSNIGVVKNPNNQGLIVKLAKNLQNLDSVATNTLTTTGAATIGGGLTVTGDTSLQKVDVTGALDVTGKTTVTQLEASGEVTLKDALIVEGQAQLKDTLVVTKEATFNGAVTANQGLTVAQGNLEVTNGNTTLKTLTVNETLAVKQKATFEQGLDVTAGKTNLNGGLTVTGGKTELQQGLEVTGDTKVANLTATGNTLLQKVDVAGALDVTGKTTVTQLEASGEVTLKDALIVEGQAQLKDTLVVDKQATFKQGVTLGDTTGPKIVRDGDNIKVQKNGGGAARITNIAAGEQDGDAVNFKQVKDGIAGITTKGLKFAGDINGEVHRELGQALTITGGVTQEGNLTDSNIGVVKNPNNQGLIVKLAKNLQNLDSVATNTLTTTGAATIGGGLTVTGDTSLQKVDVTGALDVTGKTTVTQLEASGEVTLKDALIVEGQAQLKDTLVVTKEATFNGAVTANQGLTVAQGNLEVTNGNTTLKTLTVNETLAVKQKATFEQGLDVTAGKTNLNGGLTVTGGKTELQQGLEVTGDTKVANLTATGNTLLQKVDVAGALDVTGKTTVTQLEASGEVTLKDALIVEGQAQLKDTLVVDKQATFKQGVTLGDTTGPKIVRDGDNIKVQKNGGGAARITNIAAGEQDGDAVNFKQVKDGIAGITTKGLKFAGDINGEVHRELGQALTITGGVTQEGNLTDSNIGVVKNPNNQGLIVKLAKNLQNLDSVATNTLTTTGAATIGGGLTVTGDTSLQKVDVTGALDVTGKTTVTQLEASGEVTLKDALIVEGQAQLKDTLVVTKEATFNGAVTANQGLTVAQGNLEVTNGNTTLKTLTVNETLAVKQKATFEQGLDVTAGKTNLNGGLTVTGGKTELQQGLEVTGDTKVANLTATGNTLLQKVDVAGALDVTGKTTVTQLEASGEVTLKDALIVEGQAQLKDTLVVDKQATFKQGVTLGDTTGPKIVRDGDNIKVQKNGGGAARITNIAAGEQDGDAVNFKQVKDGIAGITTKGLKFAGDINGEVHRELGQALTITGGVTQEGNLTDSNIGVVKNPNNQGLIVKLAKNLQNLDSVATNTLTTTGAATIGGGLTVTGDTSLQKVDVTGALDVTGKTTVTQLEASGEVTLKDALIVEGQAQLKDTLVVTKEATFNGAVTANQGLTVAQGNLEVTNGNTTLKTLTVNETLAVKQKATFEQGLDVTAGKTNLNGGLTVTGGKTELQQGLEVTGDTKVANLTATGNTLLQKVDVAGALDVTGKTTVTQLEASGEVTLKDALIVEGQAQLKDTLVVDKQATFKQGVTLGDTTGPKIVRDGDNIKVQKNGGGAARITNIAAGEQDGDAVNFKQVKDGIAGITTKGLKFAGDINGEVHRELGQALTITGGVTQEGNLTDSNIGVVKNPNNQGLIVKLAKNLQNLDSVATNTLTTTGAATIGGGLTVTGNTLLQKVDVTGALDVTGKTTVTQLEASGEVTLKDALIVEGQAQLKDTLVVTKEATFNGAVTANQGLTVAQGNLEVTNGNTTLKTLTVNETLAVKQKATFEQGLDVTAGKTNLNGGLTVTGGKTELQQGLEVTGDTKVANLTATGNTLLQKVDVAGALDVTGKTTVTQLEASGEVTLKDALIVEGQAQLKDTLVVDKQATFKQGVTLGDTTGPKIVRDGDNIKVQKNGGGAARITNIAAGEQDGDAVNFKQVKDGIAGITTKGLKFAGDINGEVHRELGQALTITGGVTQEGNLTDSNIGVVKNPNNQGLIVKLAKNLQNLDSVATNTLTTTGAATIGGGLTVTGDTSLQKVDVTGALDVTGKTTVTQLEASGEVTLKDALIVEGQAQLKDTLVVTKEATFNGAVTANQGLTVAQGNLEVTNGNTTLKTLTVNETLAVKQKATFEQGLDVTAGKTNLNGGLTVTGGKTELQQGLEVTGDTKVANLTATGNTLLQKVDVAGALDVTGKTTVTQLEASGEVTLKDALIVEGQAQLKDTLVVDKQATFKQGVTLGDTTGPKIVRDGDNIKVQKNGGGAARITNIAAGEQDGDAVNFKQVKDGIAGITTKGLKFAGDINGEVHRELGQALTITGGVTQEGNLTDSNIGVVKNPNNQGLIVKLAKNLQNLDSVATNTLTTTGAATIGGGLTVTGDTSLQKVDVTGALDVTGKTTVTQLEASGEVTLKDALIVEGQAQLKDTLVVTKEATFNGAVTANQGLTVAQGNLEVTNGNTTLKTLTVNETLAVKQKATFEQGLDVTAGKTNLNGGLTVTGGKTELQQGLEVTGDTKVANLTATGNTLLQKVDVAGALDVTGKTTVTQLEASGEVTLKDALIVEGQAQLKDTLVVDKQATFKQGVTLGDTTGPKIVRDGDNIKVQKNGGGAARITNIAAGEQDGDAVNFKQVKDGIAGITTKGLKFAGDINGEVHRELGQALTITGGVTQEGNLTDSNIGVVKNPNNQGLIVKLAKNLQNLDSVATNTLTTTGAATIGGGLTVTGNTLLQKVDVAGALDVTGKTTVTQLEASGEVTLKDALIVEGQAQLKDTLVVDKQATFKQGVTLGDTTGPKIVRDGDNIKVQKNGGGAARITNIAAGEQDGDAVNFKQVKDGIAGITTKGLKFAGDINGEVHRELGQALTITGGVTQEGNLTDSNIGVVKNPNNQGLIVKLAKNLQNLDSVATNTLTTTGAATIGGGLTVTGDTSLQKVDVTGALDVTGKTTVTQLEASGEVTLKDALIVEGQAQLKDTLVVTKEATFNGAVTANQGLTVAQGNLEVTNGNTTLKTLTVNETLAVKQKATFEQGLDVTAGKTNLNGGLTVTGGKTELQQGLEVTGDTKVANLTATGNTLLQKVDVAGALDVTGKTTVTQLEASGEVTLKDALIVEGQAQLKDTLVVDKQATFKQGVTLGDTTGPKIVRDGDNIKVQKNGGGAARITNIAAGEQDGDAVNFKQVKDGIAGITTKGLKFAGDINGEVHRELGQALTITGGVTQEGNLTDSNIGVVKNPNNQGLIVKLAKNLQNLDSVATNTLTTTGAATIGGGLTVTGDTSLQKVDVTGALDVTGKTTVTQLEASGEVTLKDALIVEGQAQLKDTLVVTKEATFNGAVTANQGLTVAQGNLEVTNGNTTLKTLTVNETLAVKQKATFEQGLDVTAGKTNLNGGLTVTGGKTELQQGLEVTGDTKVANLTATGNTLLQKVDVAGALDVTGKTTVTQLEASGEVTLKDALIVEGQAQLKDTLVVDKQATFKQGVTLGDTTGPKIVRDGDNIKVQKNGGGAARITNIAAGEQDGDAVNFKQVKDGIAGITTKGLKFAGDINGEVHRELGQALTITGGVTQEGNLTDSNIGVVKNPNNQGLIVKLAKNLQNLDSVATNTLTTTGAATIGGGLTVTGNTLLQKVDVAGALDVTGKTTVTQLEASGEVTLKDALIVEGQAQLKDTLVVDKQATFKQGVTLGDTTGPKIVRDGDNIKVQKNGGGAARITNIAAGEQDGDAVNFKQVKDGIAGITTKGLKFAGDINGEVHRELGQALTITGGVTQEGNLTDSNIGVVKNPNNQGLIVKLAKNLQNLDSVATNTLTTTGAATIGGGLTVTGDTSLQKVDVTGALDVTGKTTVTQLEASGEVTLKDALIVEGQAQLKDTLVVTKEATFNGAVTANQGLTVAQGNLEVTNGNTTLKTLTVNETLAVKQKATFEQGLDVTAGKTNLNGGLTVTGGKTELQQGLEVTGDTKVANLTATGNTLLQKVDVAGALDVTGKTTVTQLEASGEVTLKDALIVEGQAQLKDTLVVDKQATFKQGVTLGDTTGPKIVRDGDNIKVQKNGGGAARITNIAAGEQDGDAVNFKQVKDGIAGITTKGLKFAGDINGEVHRELGQALTITGGVTQEGNLTDSNIGVVKNPNNQGLIVKLAKNLQNLDSVATNTLTTTGAATIGGGLTVKKATMLLGGLTTVGNNVTIGDSFTIGNSLVSGDAGVQGDLYVSGDTNLKDTTVDGKLKVTKGMDVKGKSTFDAIEIPSSKENQPPLLLDNTGISGLPGNIAATADNTLSSDIDAKLDISKPTDDPAERAKRLSRAATIADVLSVGFNLKNNGASRDFIRGFDTVDFIDGKATTAVVTREGNSKTSKVTFNVNVDNDTIKLIDGNKIAANTTDLMVSNSGRLDIPMVSFDAIDNAKKLMTARDIAYAINQSGFQVISGQTGLGTNSGASEEVVRAGDLIKLIAGDNLDIKQEGTTFTFSLKKTLTLKDDKGDVTTLSPAGVKTQGNGGGSTLGNGGGSNVGGNGGNVGNGNGAGGGAVGNGGGESTVDKGGLTVADRDGNVSKVTANGVAVEGKNGSSSLEEGGLSVIGKDGESSLKEGGLSVIGKNGSSSLEETGLSVAGKNGSSSLEEGGLSVIGKDGESSLKEGGLSVIGKDGSSSLEETGLSVEGKNGSSSLEEGGLSVIGKDGESSLKEGGLSVIGKDGESSLSGDGVNVIDKDGNGGEFNAKGISLIGPKNQLNLQNNKLEMTATNAGKTNTFSIENTAEGAKVSGVADGVDPNDAVNKSQLDAQANKGLKFVGDDNQEVHRKLGETLTIAGGLTDATKLSDNNIGVMKDGDGKLVVKLAKNISGLSNIETTGRITAGDGLTVEAGGLNVKGDTTLQKTTVTDFTANGDTTLQKTVVNQTLTVEKQATFKDTVEVNNGLTVTNGETKLKNTAVNGTLNVTGNTTIDKTLIVKGDTTVEKLTANGDTTLEKSLTVKEKATFKDTVEVNNGLSVTNGETKLKNTAVNGTLNVTGNTTIDKTLIVKGDTTVEKLTANGDTTLEKSLTVKEKATFKEGITLGDATTGPQIVHEGDDTIRIQQNDGSAARITNVADGHIAPDSKDIVNGGQLMNVYNHIGKIESQLQAGIAGNNAAASLPQVMMPGKSMVSAALGGFRDKKAIAIGYSRLSDNGRMALKSNLNVDTEKNLGYGVGVGFTW